MRSFQSPATFDPVPGAIVAVLRAIDRASGAEALYRDQLPQLLEALRERARIESVTASSAIEGVVVEPNRVAGLVGGRTHRFRDRNEKEFAGYRAALDYLNQDDAGGLSVGLLLHLHRLLFQYADGQGGNFNTQDNLVTDRAADGTRTVRFEPVSARETPRYVEELVTRTQAKLARDGAHPLLVASAFALDLLCIHPFADGNGRVTRLITSYLLGETGYGVGRYVSIEALIYGTKDDYYSALSRSTNGWFDDGNHTLWPWAGYLLDQVATAYARFEARVAAGISPGTKQGRVRDFVLLHGPATFRIEDIRSALPGITDQTIRLVLHELRDAGQIVSDGAGRASRWRRT